MSENNFQLTKVRRAYRTLDVSPEASTHAIKQSYRRMLKRWHPDLYKSGTHAHVEATQMTELLNSAYSAIADAPLRYQVDPHVEQLLRQGWRSASDPMNETSGEADDELFDKQTLRLIGKIEFGTRFVCGVLFGIFLCLYLAFSVLADARNGVPLLVSCGLGVTFASGWASARYGDKFWLWVFRFWWLRP